MESQGELLRRTLYFRTLAFKLNFTNRILSDS